ncbi:Uncharacterized protein conserved in bacteria [Achromobacter insolitus]|nr:hypothetical protein [Achromobacter insolitus]APX75801.1 hypothetical protein BUW96_13600 [Achromobacter insolitus]OWT56443.1 hypothetical protein CEY08_22310 [Achromobacter insolitus]CAB3739031.1 hypothetical protein LMG6003_05540 [Achromobacter insolitus]VEG66945.1 Uncharacterized protein conserved in bacteria [Achromobacter insolitus]
MYTLPSYRSAPHHAEIARALEAVERGDIKRLRICMPPRHGKSELASKRFPAWYLWRKPNRNWFGLSVIVMPLLLALTGCASSSTSGTPRHPTPAADLMAPAPTVSVYLESVSAELKALDADLARWEKTLQDGLTK